ncbi:MAG: LysR family transcriptional regulator [Gammaproteobacteria bacterium]|nr:LysR family transcriptional regulator [Gammaproteobacteria bacterium]
MTQSLDIPSLRSFILAEKLGSFSNAADSLNCSQAALSFRIKKLENDCATLRL